MLLCKDNFHVNVISAPADAVGRRIDNFLLSYLKGISRNRVYCILRNGEVRINKKRKKWTYRLNYGDIIRIPPIYGLIKKEPIRQLSEVMVHKLHATLIYEDADLIILNKPSGIAVHGGTGLSFSIIDALRVMRPELNFLELVHRIDRETSGVLLVAKNYFALMKLHEQLRSNIVKKEYLALVSGKCNFHVNVVCVPLLKENFFLGKQIVKVNFISGKYSKTSFTVKERFISSTLLRVYPITGRTHQIRVHAQYMGHPIVCDRRYGDSSVNQKVELFGLNRLFLHASRLKFIHPANKKNICVTAPMDEMLVQCLSFLRKNELVFKNR